MAKITQKRSVFGYGLMFMLLLLGALVFNAPLATANRFLPSNVKLLSPSGNIHAGRWQDVQINGKRYPLNCDYQRQSLNTSAATYQLNCNTPFALEATLVAHFNGDVTLTNALISGNIAEARPWLNFLSVPGHLSGEIGIHVKKAALNDNTLTHLKVSGGAQRIAIFGTPVVHNVRIETLVAELSVNQPIQLEIRTPDENNADNNTVRLYLTSDIDGRNYLTQGEISGKLLGNYAAIMRFFGQQTGQNTFTIRMGGRLMP